MISGDKNNSNWHHELKILWFIFPNQVPLLSIVTDWKYEETINGVLNHDENDNLGNDHDEDSLLEDQTKINCDLKIYS